MTHASLQSTMFHGLRDKGQIKFKYMILVFISYYTFIFYKLCVYTNNFFQSIKILVSNILMHYHLVNLMEVNHYNTFTTGMRISIYVFRTIKASSGEYRHA